jgi:hypothetical protein
LVCVETKFNCFSTSAPSNNDVVEKPGALKFC